MRLKVKEMTSQVKMPNIVSITLKRAINILKLVQTIEHLIRVIEVMQRWHPTGSLEHSKIILNINCLWSR